MTQNRMRHRNMKQEVGHNQLEDVIAGAEPAVDERLRKPVDASFGPRKVGLRQALQKPLRLAQSRAQRFERRLHRKCRWSVELAQRGRMPFRLTAGNIYLFGEVKHVRSQSSAQDIGDRLSWDAVSFEASSK